MQLSVTLKEYQLTHQEPTEQEIDAKSAVVVLGEGHTEETNKAQDLERSCSAQGTEAAATPWPAVLARVLASVRLQPDPRDHGAAWALP